MISEEARASAFRNGHSRLGLCGLVQGVTKLSKVGLAQLSLDGALHGVSHGKCRRGQLDGIDPALTLQRQRDHIHGNDVCPRNGVSSFSVQ